MELPGQVLDQLAEVHTVVGGKIEHQLTAVQRVLGIHQLHLQLMGGNALFAQFKGGFLVRTVLAHAAHIHAVRQPDDRLDLPREAAGGNFMCAAHDLAAFHAAGRLHNHKFPFLDFQLLGVKVIGAAAFLKFNRDNFHFNILSIGIGVSFQGVPALPGSHFHAAHGQGKAQIAVCLHGAAGGFRRAQDPRCGIGLNAVKTGAAQSGAGGLGRLPQHSGSAVFIFFIARQQRLHTVGVLLLGLAAQLPRRGTSHLGRRHRPMCPSYKKARSCAFCSFSSGCAVRRAAAHSSVGTGAMV